MARKQEPIRTVAYVHVGNELVNIDELNQQQREYIAVKLKVAFLNAMYAGKATFYEPENMPTREEVFGNRGLN